MAENKLTHRYIARIGLEALTPLFVGSGESSLLTDALVQKDANGLPMIPGTAITGVLRHVMEDHLTEEKELNNINDIFGSDNTKNGVGSRLYVSNACMLVNNLSVAEGLETNVSESLRIKLDNLPKRQHVRITEKGVAKEHGLFDNEVVYQGIRFVCEIELKGSKKDHDFWTNMLETIQSPLFRIGQGTRNGYGNLSATVFYDEVFNLTEEAQFDQYLVYNPSLKGIVQRFDNKVDAQSDQLSHYELELTPESTFIFSSGNPDTEVNNTPTTEEVMKYTDEEIVFEEKTLIPASSIKGALSHRLTFHYNKRMNKYIGDPDARTSIDNEAVYQLFGCEANPDKDKTMRKEGHRGRIIMDDIFIDANNDKIFNHVAIDRFTGGAIDGALFSEKVSMLKNGENISINIYVEKGEAINDLIETALEDALIDVCKGMLPLGGMTTKGHGFFEGSLKKDDMIIYAKNDNNE